MMEEDKAEMSNRNPQVDAWFAERDDPMTEAMQLARQLILDADPRIGAAIPGGFPPWLGRDNSSG